MVQSGRIGVVMIVRIAEVWRNIGISEATFYRWKQLYGGLMPSEVKKLRQLDVENTRLRRVVADLTLTKRCCRRWSAASYDACSGTQDVRLRACCVPGGRSAEPSSRSGMPRRPITTVPADPSGRLSDGVSARSRALRKPKLASENVWVLRILQSAED